MTGSKPQKILPFYKLFKKRRKHLKLSLAMISKELKTSRQSVSYYEKKAKSRKYHAFPNGKKLITLLKILDIPLNSMLLSIEKQLALRKKETTYTAMRIIAGMSKKTLSDRTGLAFTTIQSFEKNNSIKKEDSNLIKKVIHKEYFKKTKRL